MTPPAAQWFVSLAVPELAWHYPHDVLCSDGRQCALVALEDVKAYLTEENGQIAVSLPCFFPISISIQEIAQPHVRSALVGLQFS